MSEYNEFVPAINKIFAAITIIKNKYTDKDNIEYLEKIISYQQQLIEISKSLPKEIKSVQELGQ